MKTKRLHQVLTSTPIQQLLTLPIVTLVMVASLSGCATSPGVDRHSPNTVDRHSIEPNNAVDRHSSESKEITDLPNTGVATAMALQVPYAVPVIRIHPGVKATPSKEVRQCPAGALRYCDHRRNRCSCVNAVDTTRALGVSRTGF